MALGGISPVAAYCSEQPGAVCQGCISTGPQPMGVTRKPSEADCVGRGGARERVQFSSKGGNGAKQTLRRRGFGEAPQQAFWQAILSPDGAKFLSVFTLELLAKNASVATLALLAVSETLFAILVYRLKSYYNTRDLYLTCLWG